MIKSYNGKSVFVTGHTGFKGSWLCEILIQLNANVTGYSLAPNTDPAHFTLLGDQVQSTIGDLADFDKLKKAMIASAPEVVFHLAAQPLVRESYADPFGTYSTNVLGTLNVLRAAQEISSVRAIVIITTDKVYENKEWEHPYRESDQLGGYDMYSSSKACCEILVSSFRNSFLNTKEYGTKHNKLIASARAGNVIGGGDWSKDRLIPDVVKATAMKQQVKVRSPHAVRPWQHVLDCLYGYLLLGEKLLDGNAEFASAWNFAPFVHETKTVKEVLEISCQTWEDISISYEPDPKNLHEASLLKLDNSKAISRLNWKPVYNTEQAIAVTIQWYKDFYLRNDVTTKQQVKEFLSKLD
jgi:CDP-glucose 4,6-dehydratase